MAVRIITDSASDISQAEAKEWGITVIPMNIRFGEEQYKDGIDIDHNLFYGKLLETDELPKTSQIPPYDYEKVYEEAVEAGDEVLCITVTSELSGCYQSAMLAADEFDGKVKVIDSRQAAQGQYVLAKYASICSKEGGSLQEVYDKVMAKMDKVRVIGMLDTLEYLKLGGRISATAAAIGSVFSIKPVVTTKDGEIAVYGKARGSKKANNLLRQFVSESNGIDFDMPVCVACSGLTDEILTKYMEDSHDLYEGHDAQVTRTWLGSAIGTYAGPGAIVLGFFAAE